LRPADYRQRLHNQGEKSGNPKCILRGLSRYRSIRDFMRWI
jgi:hypothetical protein